MEHSHFCVEYDMFVVNFVLTMAIRTGFFQTDINFLIYKSKLKGTYIYLKEFINI